MLEIGDYAEAEQFVQPSQHATNMRKTATYTMWSIRLSMLESWMDGRTALSRSITCTILAAPGHARSRMLTTLYKDPRAAQLPSFPLLEKLYLDRLIKANELIEFERELQPHQRTNEHGHSIVEGVIVEHNMTAVSRLYNNIALSTLAELLGISSEKLFLEFLLCKLGTILDLKLHFTAGDYPISNVTQVRKKAEEIVAQMISSERLTGYIDQLEGFIHFEQRDPLKLWDEQIMMFCQLVNKVSDMIVQQHPEVLN
ncbi:hypothetical protein KIN20_028610 [Parelaphostrongylus tenuis]|uniref:COP9 signalosome complex subunit 4 n=1 Tax=Parelaphostrongylus tenuis TaxID=148309 RepID=A0AAD5WEX8_PARTN|nr:hypothetical protein KIN20_028610 [Parelaphostrongylus tenuis]